MNFRDMDKTLFPCNSQIKDERDISMDFVLLERTSSDLSDPIVSLFQISQIESDKIVNIGKSLFSIPVSIKFVPHPISNVVFSFTLMSNTIEPCSFKPHDSCLDQQHIKVLLGGRVRKAIGSRSRCWVEEQFSSYY